MKAHLYEAGKRDANFLEVNYTPVQETRYTVVHPHVVHWTRYFQSRCRRRKVFESISRARPSRKLASIVGTQWYRFSDFMPWFLCRAASEVSDNRTRHYVIQTAFEELGERNENGVHSELFREAVLLVGVPTDCFARRANAEPTTRALTFLREALLEASDEAQVLGLILGLEIPAEENIETIFRCLSHNEAARLSLHQHRFFKLHRCIEPEHVRLAVSNFLRFCRSEGRKRSFLKGFDQGVEFWAHFWMGIAEQAGSRRKDHA